MSKDPWTDPDPEPGEFDDVLAGLDLLNARVVDAGPGGRVRLVVSDAITNERQYRIAKDELRRFTEAIEAHDEREPDAEVDPKVYRALRDSLESEAEELAAQIARYEDLREDASSSTS